MRSSVSAARKELVVTNRSARGDRERERGGGFHFHHAFTFDCGFGFYHENQLTLQVAAELWGNPTGGKARPSGGGFYPIYKCE